MGPEEGLPLGAAQGGVVAALGERRVEVWLRPLENGEQAAVLEVFAHLSARSRALRFLRGVQRLDGQLLERLTDVDQDRHVAWVACDGRRAVGVGRYARVPGEPGAAEVGLAVADDHQRQGIGRVLVEVLLVVAASSGVTTLVFHVHYTNRPVLRLLAGYGAAGGHDGGVVDLRVPVAVPPSLPFAPEAVRALAATARRGATAAA